MHSWWLEGSSLRGDVLHDRDAWEKSRRKRVGGRGRIDLALEDIELKREGEEAYFSFRQSYRLGGFSDAGRKELRIERRGGRWVIVQETFAGQAQIEKRVRPGG